MSSDLPDLDDLAVLVLVAETGSIGRAAARLGQTQPSLSRRMSALERSMDVVLLDRSHTGTTLTPAGRAVVDWASVLLGAADDFVHSVATLRARRNRGLRVAVSMTIAEHYAPQWLATLRQRAPDLDVSLAVGNSAEVTELVQRGRVEIGFLETPLLPAGLTTRRIGRDRLVVAVRPDHPWASRREITASALASTPLLVREEGSGTRVTVEHALKTRGLGLTPRMAMASNAALKSVALTGLGPVVLARAALATVLSSGELVEVRVRGLDLSRPLTVVARPGTRLSEQSTLLVSVATAALRVAGAEVRRGVRGGKY